MATATQTPTVILDREQRKAVCDLLWTEITEAVCGADDAWEVRLVMATGRLFEALDWPAEAPESNVFDLLVDDEIGWLATGFLEPQVEEYVRPKVAWALGLASEARLADIDEASRATLIARADESLCCDRAIIRASEAISEAAGRVAEAEAKT